MAWSGISKILPLVSKLGSGSRSFHLFPVILGSPFPRTKTLLLSTAPQGRVLLCVGREGGSLYGSLDHETSHIRVASQ